MTFANFELTRYRTKRMQPKWDYEMQMLTNSVKELGTKKVDFNVPEDKRTFALTLNDGKLYVNPHYFLTMSDKFKERFEAINDINGEACYEDITASEMKTILESVCPTIHHLYPMPIQICDLPSIIPIACKLKMPILLNLCGKVLEHEVPDNILTPYGYLKYFDLAYRYGLGIDIQAKLLCYLLDFDFVKNVMFMDEAILSCETGNLYYIALTMKHRGRFPHEVYDCLLMPSEMQNVRCERCAERKRLQKKRFRRRNRKKINSTGLLTPCRLCSKLLCDNCILSPCTILLKKFLSENPPSRFHQLSL